MKRVLTGHDEVFGPWLAERLGIKWIPGLGVTIGLWDDLKGPIAAAMYEGCNGSSVRAHLVAEGSLTREFLWYGFYYPFEELGVNKVIGLVESTNKAAIKLDEHFGYVLEATLKEAAPNGDLLIYTMTREQCRWLNLRGKCRGQAKDT